MLFDDVKINEIPSIGQVLELTDRYPLQVKIHNGFDCWKPKVIVFTSNYPPEEWWNLTGIRPSFDAFMDRVTKVEHLVYKGPRVHATQEETDDEEVQWPPCQEEYSV